MEREKSISLRASTLLNYVLNDIPLFMFFFYKAMKVVIQYFIKIQRAFLWNGQEKQRRINWVTRSTICMLKEHEGLGMKHCELVNTTLISK